MMEVWKPKRDITAPRPDAQWLFENRRTLAQAQRDRAALRALQTGKLSLHPSALTKEPWKTLIFRRDAAL